VKPDETGTAYHGRLFDALFFAEGVEAGEASPEADEAFELVRWHVSELESRLPEIEDAKSLVGLLLYLRDTSRRASA
jgi:hypothetical protein